MTCLRFTELVYLRTLIFLRVSPPNNKDHKGGCNLEIGIWTTIINYPNITPNIILGPSTLVLHQSPSLEAATRGPSGKRARHRFVRVRGGTEIGSTSSLKELQGCLLEDRGD